MGAAVLASLAPAAGRLLGGLFGPGVDPRIKADLDPAIQRGDVPYLIAWITDIPPHPRDSVAYAQAHLQQAAMIAMQRQALAQATGAMQYGGRLSGPQITPPTPYSTPSAYEPTGFIPVQTSQGTIGVPYNG